MTDQAWVAVVGFEGIYEVSSLGRVRRIGRAAKNGKNHGGGEKEQLLVHCVVAAAFLGPKPDGKEVNHVDTTGAHAYWRKSS